VRRGRDIDWTRAALTGDSGAVPERRAIVASAARRRLSKASIALLLLYLLWEVRGFLFAAEVGPPIVSAMWSRLP